MTSLKEIGATTSRQAARRNATDAKIAKASLELLRREGLDGVTIDNVAAEGGVAKTTIYRRYKDRFEMLAGVLADLSTLPDKTYPYTRAGLADLIGDCVNFFETYVGISGVGLILTNRKDALDEWRENLVDPYVRRFREFFDEGVRAGDFREGADHQHMIELILGSMIVGDLWRGGLPEDWAATTADLIWTQIASPVG